MIINLRQYGQKDGSIVPVEFGELPFIPVRLFYIFDVPTGEIRGNHAHKKCEQLIICVSGDFTLKAEYGNGVTEERTMYNKNQAYCVKPKTWLTLSNFSAHATCLVLASRPYELEDYINVKSEIR